METFKTKNSRSTEFSPEEEDNFEKYRRKGPVWWIAAHIFHGTNKLLIFIVIFTTIFGSNLSSISLVIVGNIVNKFIIGNIQGIIFDIIIVLVLNIGAPIVRLVNFMLREVLAQRMERDTRKEFFTNLLGKSQSFHDRQKIGDLMARATDDVRNLNYLMSPAISLIFESFTQLVVPTVYIFLFYPPQLAITPIIFSIIFLIALRSYYYKIGPVTRDLRKQYGKRNSVLNES
jgi:ATP-binding cassette subfamily B protein